MVVVVVVVAVFSPLAAVQTHRAAKKFPQQTKPNQTKQYIPVWGWRLSLALSGSPAVLLVLGCFFVPDTPDSLVVRGREGEAEKVLRRIRGAADVSAELEDIRDAADAAKRSGNQWRTILRPAYRPQLVLALALPVLQQLTGINSVIFYAPQLFSSLGAGGEASLLSAVVIGSTGVLTTLVSLALVDRVGRKALFVEGGVQMLVTQVAIGAILATQFLSPSSSSASASLPPASATAVLVLICVYVAGFAWSWGPLTWLVCTEVQPLETRSSGYAMSVSANFLATFVIGQAFLPMLCGLQWGIFLLFAGWVAIMTAFVVVCLPETKGVALDEIQRELFLTHRVWGPMVRRHWPADDAEKVVKSSS
jgi:MFS transporter, SP family, sugar:H+ symporter